MDTTGAVLISLRGMNAMVMALVAAVVGLPRVTEAVLGPKELKASWPRSSPSGFSTVWMFK